jgi:esterase/lipase
VPAFFIEGRHDHEVPSEIAARYFAALRAPSKELIWFENSAHMVNSEERESFDSVLIEKVRPIAVGGGG